MPAVGPGNPAAALRASVAALHLPGMLRWDQSGEALLLSDAPRRMPAQALAGALAPLTGQSFQRGGLLWIDLPAAAYDALLEEDLDKHGPWDAAWFEAQALLAGMLARPARGAIKADVPLLRAALLACAQGERTVRAYLHTLRRADAEALRHGQTTTVRACAVCCAQWLWQAEGVGLPAVAAGESRS